MNTMATPKDLCFSGRPAGAQVTGSTDMLDCHASAERLLTTAEANEFLCRARGFLEKRRSSGIDSPPYIQASPLGLVRYRVADLLAWEESKMRTNTSYE